MLEAAVWGLIAGSSLVIGAAIGLALRPPARVIALVLGFGAGTLISAVAYELTEDAFALGGADTVTLGLAAGAVTFFIGDWLIDRRGGDNRMSPMGMQAGGAATALLLGAILDGIPESAVIGITLLEGEGIGIAVVVAVFLSNLPEALSSATGLRMAGHSARWVLGVWTAVMLVCGVAAALGYGLLEGAPDSTIGFINAFAGGAVLMVLADAMMPEAFKHGGKAAGLATVLGFAVAFLLTTLD